MNNKLIIEKLNENMSRNFEYFLSIIQSEPFLKGRNFPQKNEDVISDKDVAWDMYSNEAIEPPYDNWVDIMYSYNFLGGFNKSSMFEGIIDPSEQLTDQENMRLINMFDSQYHGKLYNIIEKVLAEINLSDFVDFVVNDFYNFMLFYTYLDQKIPFIEDEIRIYQNGGFPCGWKGEFPEGGFVVFSPEL